MRTSKFKLAALGVWLWQIPACSSEPDALELMPVAAPPEGRRVERWYQERIAAAMDGRMEARVENGRVDVLISTHAIEVEFARLWKQAIGQSLWYALQTGKEAGIVLVIEDEKRDRPHVIRLGSVIQAHMLPIRVWLWPDDFID
jgi:hypothetical protein